MKLDLHIHSTYSDGWLTPKQILEKSLQNNINIISLTDHDSIAGVTDIMSFSSMYNDKIKIIPGVEISTKLSDKYTEKASVHILGYFVDFKNKQFIESLNYVRDIRVKRFTLIKQKLKQLGYKTDITVEDAKKHSLGRPHLANDLVKNGYFATIQDAFDKLLAKDKPAYVSLDTFTQKEAIDLIHSVGGLAFLAHPAEVKSYKSVEYLLTTLSFDGLEVYHPSVLKKDEYMIWLKLAEKHHLRISGGSDFHGSKDRFPKELGIFTVTDTMIDKIFCIK